MANRIKTQNIQTAFDTIAPVFLNSPQFRYERLEEKLGCRLLVKLETFNPVRSFKGRGASYLMSSLKNGDTIVCASAGNLGQAIAYAAREKGIRSVIFASVTASPMKIDCMRGFGAEVILEGVDFDAAKLAASEYALKNGFLLIEDSLLVETCEGAGTIGLELLKWDEPLDAVVVALGNGAMLTGIATWIKCYAASTEIIGVVPKGAPAMADSFHRKERVCYDATNTISDGIAVRNPIPEVLADMSHVVDKVLIVDDEMTREAMKMLHSELGVVAEPSGAVGLAAVMANRQYFSGKLVAIVVCGGNLAASEYGKFLY